MAFKKFIRKNGKRYGPYVYHNKRVNGKVVTSYVGKHEKDRRVLFYALVFIAVVALGLILLFNMIYPTGRVILDLDEVTLDSDAILGRVRLILNEGELIPYDSNIIINLNDQNIVLPINSLITREKETGTYHIENTNLEGSGEGFGIKGTKTEYPVIYFRLKIEKTVKSDEPDTSVPGSSGETQEESEEEQDEKDGAVITTHAILSDYVDGQVTGLVNFEYELDAGEEASIIIGSVSDGVNDLDEIILSLVVEGNIVKVSTDYVIEEQGFGLDYIGLEEIILEIDFAEFNVVSEEGILSLEVTYDNHSLLYGEKIIVIKEDVYGVPPSEEPSEEQQVGDIIEKLVPSDEVLEENLTEDITEQALPEENITEEIEEETDKGTQFGAMAGPSDPSVFINSSQGTNTSIENITCWVSASDADSTYLNYSGFWYKNGEQQFDNWSAYLPTGPINTENRDVAVDNNGNVIVVGHTTTVYNNVSVVKYYPNGTKMWNNTYGGGVTDIHAYGVAVDNESNIWVVGEVNFFGGDGQDLLIIKYNSSGSYLWNKSLDLGSNEILKAGEFLSNGNFVAAGGYEKNISVYNSSGDLVLTWNISSFELYDIAIDSQDNIIATGTEGGSCYETHKYNSSGNLIWNYSIGCGITWSRWSYGVSVDSNDNVVITGVTFNYDIVTVMYNSSGSYLWNDTYVNGIAGDYGRDVAVDSRDNVYVLGSPTASGDSLFIVKYNSSGSRVWNKTTGHNNTVTGYGLKIDSEDNIVFSGVDDYTGFVSRLYGFNLKDQTPGVSVNVSNQDQEALIRDDIWACEVKAFDGGDYTNYTKANMTMLSVILSCGINITEHVTANGSLSCNDTALNIVSSGVSFDCGGISITGNLTPGSYGVRIKNGINDTTLQNCVISNFSDGIYISNSSDSTIDNNVLQNNVNSGVRIEACYNNTISSNTISNNVYGLYSSKSFSNTYSNNLLSGNSLTGIYFLDCFEETLTINDIENNTLYGLLMSNGTRNDIDDNNLDLNYDGIFMNYSSNNTLSLNELENNTDSGVYFYNSNDNTLSTGIAKGHNKSVFIQNSSNNTVYSNTIINSSYGIFLINSSYNLIYDNYFNNTINAYDLGNNLWNTTLELRENILSGDYLGGNFWSDYLGNDSDRDGIGDTLLPFNASGNISGSGDWLPLVEPFRTVKMITLLVNSSNPSNTPDNDITCWANATHENNSNITYHGVWHKNTEQIFDSSWDVNFTNISSYFDIHDVGIDSQNNIVAVADIGLRGDLVTIKLNSSGSLRWNQSFGPGDDGKGIDVDSQDNIIVVGYNSSISSGITMNLVKYNSSGSYVWNASLNSTFGYDVAVDSSDNITVVGRIVLAGLYNYKTIIIKYNSSGSHLWNTTNSPKTPSGVVIDSQDNAIIIATQYLTTVVSKYSSNGTLIWNKSYDVASSLSASYAVPAAIAVDSYNEIYITGSTDDSIFTAKIDKYGNLIWIKDFYLPYWNYGKSITVDQQDNVLVGGSLNSSVAIVVKYDSDGNELWYELLDGVYSSGWEGIAVDSKFDIVVGGRDRTKKYYGFSLNNQLPGQLKNVSTISSSLISSGDTWKCEVIAFDVENYSRYKLSNELTLYTPGTSGGGAGACISSWSCGDPGSCTDGSAEVICTDTKGCLFSTNMPSGCVSSGHAKCIKTVSCDEEDEEESNETIVEDEGCNEDWTCEGYGNCEVDGYKYPLNCIDMNDCGTDHDKPEPIFCDCTPVLECGEWQECRVDYGFDDLVEAEYIDLNGTQIRNCFDTNDCIGYPVEEEQECSISVPVSLIEEAWGNETYVFVLDESNQTVARVKIGSLFLTFMPTSYLGYFDYCFNEIRDYDETGVDCGGSCPECAEGYKDNFILIKSLVLAFSFVAAFFTMFSLMRSFAKSHVVKEVVESVTS